MVQLKHYILVSQMINQPKYVPNITSKYSVIFEKITKPTQAQHRLRHHDDTTSPHILRSANEQKKMSTKNPNPKEWWQSTQEDLQMSNLLITCRWWVASTWQFKNKTESCHKHWLPGRVIRTSIGDLSWITLYYLFYTHWLLASYYRLTDQWLTQRCNTPVEDVLANLFVTKLHFIEMLIS